MTIPDYASSISLLPTDDFLRYVAEKQWGSGASFGVGFSTITPLFYSTTNSEWLCLNSESEFLISPQGTASIKNPFSYTRPESSPVFVALDDISVKPQQIRGAKSLFLFRSIGTKSEVITVSNYAKSSATTAPPLDCFSRECLSWFSSDVDWFVGFGTLSNSLSSLVVGDDGIILNSSTELIESIIPGSTKPCPFSNISILGTTSSLTPFVTLQLSTTAEYIKTESTPSTNLLFLYNSDSIVAFCHEYTTPQLESISYDILSTEIRWKNEDVIII